MVCFAGHCSPADRWYFSVLQLARASGAHQTVTARVRRRMFGTGAGLFVVCFLCASLVKNYCWNLANVTILSSARAPNHRVRFNYSLAYHHRQTGRIGWLSWSAVQKLAMLLRGTFKMGESWWKCLHYHFGWSNGSFCATYSVGPVSNEHIFSHSTQFF